MDTCQKKIKRLSMLPNGYLPNLNKSRIIDGLEIRYLSRANQGICQSNIQRHYCLCIIKRTYNKCTASILRAFRSTIARKSSHIQFSLIFYICITYLLSVEDYCLLGELLGLKCQLNQAS